MYYHICPHCGASLDPGERCGCIKRKAASAATEHGKEMCVYNTNQHLYCTHRKGICQMNMVNISATLDETIYIKEALEAYRDCFTESLAELQKTCDEATEPFKNAITSISTILYKVNRIVEGDTTRLQNQNRGNPIGSSDQGRG